MLKDILNPEKYLPFVPPKETLFRSKGVVHKVRKLLFPGYIIVQTEVEAKAITEELSGLLIGFDGVFSLLHYSGDKKDVAIHEEERLYREQLFNEDFCIDGSEGFVESDTIQITSGALVGMESKIKRINRHKREAIIEIQMLGVPCEVSVMLEIVRKV